jgi:D-psicose/D-tagatose/L-ribulose 3-epimerase
VAGRTFIGMMDSIDSVCRYAQQYEIKLGIEPANKAVTDLVNSAAEAKEVCAALEYSNLGVVLDTGHIHRGDETPEQALKTLGPLLFQVHVNDNDGMRQQNLAPGEGTFDFGGFLSHLRRANYGGFLSAELAWDYTLDPLPAVQRSRERMRRLLESLAAY